MLRGTLRRVIAAILPTAGSGRPSTGLLPEQPTSCSLICVTVYVAGRASLLRSMMGASVWRGRCSYQQGRSVSSRASAHDTIAVNLNFVAARDRV